MVVFGGDGSNGAGESSAIDCGLDGGAGENCGEINIYGEVTVYAYGGGGASGGVSASSSGGGGGGYPAAGIGGGGAGAGGGDHVGGGGGYTGGNQEPDGLADRNLAKVLPVNGMAGNPTSGNTRGVGGGYFSAGSVNLNTSLGNLNVGAIGGGGGKMGWYTSGGDGGIAGKGGKVTVSSFSRIYAYNGNKYTDGQSGHEYNDGANAVEIYVQKGILLKIIKNQSYWTNAQNTLYSNVFGKTFNFSADVTSMYIYALLRDYKVDDTLKLSYGQGIGSGAGYIELSNGTYTIDPTLN